MTGKYIAPLKKLKLWFDYRVIAFFIIGMIVGLLTYPTIQALSSGLTELLYSFVPEVFGIIVTVLLIDKLYELRDERKHHDELQRQLIRDVRSGSSEAALKAIAELRERKWLIGPNGLLKEQNLTGANLEGCNLENANLSGANLSRVNLSKTILDYADFSNASISYALFAPISCKGVTFENAVFRDSRASDVTFDGCNFIHADLANNQMENSTIYRCRFNNTFMRFTRLSNAKIYSCNFEDADLCEADFRATDLRGSSLKGVKLQLFMDYSPSEISSAKFDAETILPDETRWGSMNDLVKFGVSLAPISHDDHWVFEKGTYFKITNS